MRIGHGGLLLFVVLWAGRLWTTATAEEASTTGNQPAASAVSQAPAGRFEERTFQDASGPHKYLVYLPPGYSKERRWPVILFLHGAGERGRDGVSPSYVGLGPVLRHSPELYPCVVVFPQCETWDDRIFTSWSIESGTGHRALAILEEVERTESIDPTQRSLTGWSMGGFGATALAAYEADHWQSVLAVSGGFAGVTTEPLQKATLWIIHGTKDTIVSVEKSQQLATSLGMPISHTHYDEVALAGHEVWEQVYSDPRVAQWLLSGGPHPDIDWSIPSDPAQLPTVADGAPFVPAAAVTQAVTLRIGNDALRMLAAGIPESVKPEQLQGALSDVEQSFTIDGETYQLTLSKLTYAGKIESAELSTQAGSKMLADVGVKLELQIGRATLKTRGFEAQTGSFRIVMGHRRPVQFNVLLTLKVRDQKLSITLNETRFLIPDDNWYVEMPQEITLSGNKFTRHEIETGIVGGLYTRKKDVEAQILSVIPLLVERVEQRLDLDDSRQLTRWLWPFPVYQPRLRWILESLKIDTQGMTVQLGATIGASGTSEVAEPFDRRSGSARLPVESEHSTNLHVTIDPLLMEVVSEEFAESGAARINVLDLPEPRFQEFANPERMRKVLPGLAPGTEIQTVLAMSSPFRLRGEPAPGGRGGVSHLNIPSAQLEVFSRERPDLPWGQTGQFAIALDQAIKITLDPAPTGPPTLGVMWSAEPEFKVTSTTAIDPPALAELEHDMREAWVSWSQTRNMPPAVIEDIAWGDSRLRLSQLTLGDRLIDAHLTCPMASITAACSTPLKYRVRGPQTYWSRTRTLDPGQTHRYEIVDPLEWQIIGVRETYTLRPGEVARWEEATGVADEPPRPADVSPTPAAE